MGVAMTKSGKSLTYNLISLPLYLTGRLKELGGEYL